jgi:hypothetical protein
MWQMRRFSPLLVAISLLLSAQEAAAGAKDGKIRWMNNKDTTGKYKVLPPIKVEANQSYKIKLVFKANELAEFLVIGDGDTDIDLVVLDSSGKKVAEDVDPAERASDLCVCRWNPIEEQEYTIIIINHDRKLYNTVTAACN